jgi:hypothetical protein
MPAVAATGAEEEKGEECAEEGNDTVNQTTPLPVGPRGPFAGPACGACPRPSAAAGPEGSGWPGGGPGRASHGKQP